MTESLNNSVALEVRSSSEFAQSVADGLTRRPKQLPAKYLYDSLGSILFEAICRLQWYKVTRAEQELLQEHAAAIMSQLGDVITLVELGSGSGMKLSVLLSALDPVGQTTHVHLVDISSSALRSSALALAGHSGVTVVQHETQYEVGLRASLGQREPTSRVLVMCLGSNIGNLNPHETHRFLAEIRDQCRLGDQLLLGVDLIKPEEDLLLAYDDPLGVTAAFNKNLLSRINRELDADFDLSLFKHRVVWKPDTACIESYLESQRDQIVCVRGASCCVSFTEGELIWTESSYKYEPENIISIGTDAGFSRLAQWIEPESKFALTLFEVQK